MNIGNKLAKSEGCGVGDAKLDAGIYNSIFEEREVCDQNDDLKKLRLASQESRDLYLKTVKKKERREMLAITLLIIGYLSLVAVSYLFILYKS